MFTLSRKSRGFRARTDRQRAPDARRMELEQLERRTLLSFPPLPVVPGPGETQILQNALRFARNQQINAWDNQPIPFAVVGTNLTTGQTTIAKNNPTAGANAMRVDIDVDSNPNTGKGGKDVSVSVSTELFLNGVLNPHLLATYDRLGSAPFAQNFEVLVSFPFSAFAPEFFQAGTIPDANLFMGYKTFASSSTDPTNGPGGNAPLKEQIRFIPNTMLGDNHPLVQIQLATTSAPNPLQFITGFFGGTNVTGILDAAGYAAWVKQPPATASIGVGVANSAIADPFATPFSGSINLDWRDSALPTARTKVVFDYLEQGQAVAGQPALGNSDFDTTITFDPIANHETISLAVNEAGEGSYSLTHTARNAADTAGQTTNLIQVRSARNDGLVVIGSATDVPPDVSVGIGLDGTTELGVPAVQLDVTPLGGAPGTNTLDLKLEIMKTRGDGFLSTADLLGYNLGYVALSGNNLPDLEAGYVPDDPATLDLDPGIGVRAKNAGESIGYVEVVVDDDAHYGAIVDGLVMHDADPSDTIETPDDLYTGVVDNRPVENGLVKADLDEDGIFDDLYTGTLAGRSVIAGKFDVNGSGTVTAADDLGSFLVGLATPPDYFAGLPGQPGTLHHLFSLVDDGEHGTAVARIVGVIEATLNLNADDIANAFVLNLAAPTPLTGYLRTTQDSNIIPGHDIEVTLNVINIPAGQSSFNMDYPTDFKYDLPFGAEIDEIHAFGHIDCMFFDVLLQDLPNKLEFHFDPDGEVSVLAQDSSGNPDFVGSIQVHLWHQEVPNFVCPDDALLPDSPLPNLLGAELQEARLRLDHVPSFAGNWSDTDTTTSIDFDTVAASGEFAFLDGAQVMLSTVFDPENPMPELEAADEFSAHYLTFHDEGTDTDPDPDVVLRKDLAVGAFGINSFTYDSDDDAASYALSYRTDSPHPLVATFDSRFGGKFFPDKDVDASLGVTNVPGQFDLAVDMDPSIVYTADIGIGLITVTGSIDDSDDDTANGVDFSIGLQGLPNAARAGIIADEVKIINGALDLDGDGNIDGDDTGQLAGVNVLGGLLDLTGNGSVSASDDGRYFGIVVIDGALDVDASGTVDNADDGGVAGADVVASGGIDQISFNLVSQDDAVGIFGSDFRVIQGLVDGVPGQFVLSFGGERFLLETRNAAGNPDGIDQITALASTSKSVTTNNERMLPFQLNGPVDVGGPILNDPLVTGPGPGGSRINYTHFLQEVDRRYYNGGVPDPSGILSRLAKLYADSEQLDTGEDHLIVRKSGDDINFLHLDFNDFQKAAWTPNANGGIFEYAAPGRGDESFFAGQEEDGEFTTIEIEHVPDSIVVDFDKTEHLVYDASTSPGEIDFYQGPGDGTTGLFAGDTDDATRAIMLDAPSDVRVFWNFSFPNGGAFFDASNPFTLLFLTQDGSSRITAGVAMEDLHVGWGIDVLSFDVTKSIEIWNPFGDNFVIPIAWELFQFRAGIDNDADGLTLATVGNTDEMVANDDKQDVAGFFQLYNLETSPFALDDGGPAAADDEFVPFISVQSEGFKGFFIDFIVELDPTNPDCDLYPIDLEFNADTSKVGELNFDVWSADNTDFTDDDDIPFIPEVGFVNPPDYTDNTPIHIFPGLLPFPEGTIANGLAGIHVVHDWVITWDGFHTFNDHFDPFDGVPAPPFDGNDNDGGFDAGDLDFLVTVVGPFNGALQRWQDVLVSSGVYSADDAAALINDIANNTTITTHAFADDVIGDSTGDHTGATIRIDPDGGGFEWFVDPSPFDDAEFAGGGGPPPLALLASDPAAIGRLDMLTFFEHEIGHILGFVHADQGVMLANLRTGRRRLPVNDDVLPGDPPTPTGGGDPDTSSALRVIDEIEEVPGLLD
jgi:hypothetical protein